MQEEQVKSIQPQDYLRSEATIVRNSTQAINLIALEKIKFQYRQAMTNIVSVNVWELRNAGRVS